MRKITHLVLHCTASPQTQTVQTILNYWKDFNGWKSPGYHFLISADGKAHRLADDNEVTNGVKGHNANSLHLSYIGGIDKKGHAVDNRTPAQIATQIRLIKEAKAKYPKAKIVGHRDFLEKGKPGWKECPSFDVAEWLKKTPELKAFV